MENRILSLMKELLQLTNMYCENWIETSQYDESKSSSLLKMRLIMSSANIRQLQMIRDKLQNDFEIWSKDKFKVYKVKLMMFHDTKDFVSEIQSLERIEAAKIIQNIWRIVVTSPKYRICKSRFLYEFNEMSVYNIK